METPSNKHKHLEFIQAVVNRMAGNMFLLKGWSITLIAALIALAAKDSNKFYILIAYLPLSIFWLLDGYFLSLERRFRALYDYVRKLDESKIDFSMNTHSFSTDYRNTWAGAISSRTLVSYYVGLATAMSVIMLFIR